VSGVPCQEQRPAQATTEFFDLLSFALVGYSHMGQTSQSDAKHPV